MPQEPEVSTSLDPLHSDHADLRIRLAEPEVEDDPSDPMNHVHADLRIVEAPVEEKE